MLVQLNFFCTIICPSSNFIIQSMKSDSSSPSSSSSSSASQSTARRLRRDGNDSSWRQVEVSQQFRLGFAIALLASASLTCGAEAELVRNVLYRVLAGEGCVQMILAAFVRASVPFYTPYHVLVSTLWIGTITMVIAPMELSLELVQVLFGLAMVPVGVVMMWQGILDAQLKYHMSDSYWALFERDSVEEHAPKFVLTKSSRASLTAVLTLTQLMVQLLHIGGMGEPHKRILIQARDNFIFRVKNSGSLRHKAIATELFFRVVAGLLMHRTAQQMVEPSGPLSFIEKQFSKRLLDNAEIILKPLPAPLDPDSVTKLIVLTMTALLGHKHFFKSIKAYQGGKLHPALQSGKYVTRFSILVYFTGRFFITQGKSEWRYADNTRPPMYL